MEDLPKLALSVRQPWAWALIHGGKDVENRSRAPSGAARLIGRRLAIHASSGMTREEYCAASAFMLRIGVTCPPPADLARGGVIGSVRLVRIDRESDSPWFFGPCGLVVDDPRPCDPIASTGALGLFDWRPGTVNPPALREALPWMRAFSGARQVATPAPLFGDGM